MDSDPTAPFAEQVLKAVLTYAGTLEEARGMIMFAETIDRCRLKALQLEYADFIAHDTPAGPSKYIDIGHWIGLKFSVITKLGLLHGPARSILDIGTGAGHFISMAQYYGHQVMGIDVEVPLYRDLANLLGVRRILQGVYLQTPLPSFGRKFDLITAFMVSFNSIIHTIPRRYWATEDWEFFINDLIVNHLVFPGQVSLLLNQNQADDGSYYPDTTLMNWFESRGAIVNHDTGEVDLRFSEPVWFGDEKLAVRTVSRQSTPAAAAAALTGAMARPLILKDVVAPWNALLAPGFQMEDVLKETMISGAQTIATAGGQRPGEAIVLRAEERGLIVPEPGAHCFVCSLGAFKMLVRGEEDDDEFAISICRFISDNVVHSHADQALCRIGPDSWPFFVDRLVEKFFFSDQPLALHCGEVTCFAAYVLTQAGYKTRRISLVNYDDGHIVLEVLLPRAGIWALVDPDYGIMLRSPEGSYIGSPQLDAEGRQYGKWRLEFLSRKSWLLNAWNFRPGFRGQFTWTPDKSTDAPTVNDDRYRAFLRGLEAIAVHDFVFLENGEMTVRSRDTIGPDHAHGQWRQHKTLITGTPSHLVVDVSTAAVPGASERLPVR